MLYEYLKTLTSEMIHLAWKTNNKEKNQHFLSPEINPQIYGQLIYSKEGKNIKWEKDSSVNDVGKTGQLHVKE